MSETSKGTSNSFKDPYTPYKPLIETATNLICEITNISNNAEYNRKICNALIERAKLAKYAIDTLQRRKHKYEDKFRDSEYYRAFVRFIYVLKEIKKLAAGISDISVFKNYTTNLIEEKFQKLTNNYDVAVKDLHFTMAIFNEEQRKVEEEALKEDLARMSKYLEKVDNESDTNNDHDENEIEIKTSEALESCEKLIKFIQQQDEKFEIDYKLINDLKKLQKKNTWKVALAKQISLDNFF